MGKTRNLSARAPSQRQLRVGELVRRALSDILTRGQAHDPVLESRPITVTQVCCSSDLKIASVYFLSLGGDGSSEIAKALIASRAELRRLVAARLELKYAPELRFYLDESFDQAERMRGLLNEPHVRQDLEPE